VALIFVNITVVQIWLKATIFGLLMQEWRRKVEREDAAVEERRGV